VVVEKKCKIKRVMSFVTITYFGHEYIRALAKGDEKGMGELKRHT
jgi:hypothetical protein